VLLRPKGALWDPAPTPSGASPTILRFKRKAWPVLGGQPLVASDDDVTIPSIKVLLSEHQDPHEAFYKAAMKMQRGFAEQSRRMLLATPEYLKRFSSLVTLVDTPIFAGSLLTSGRYKPEERERGFYLEISYTPHVVQSRDLELNGWEVYSESGEYPIEIPTDVDFDRLLALDRLVVERKADPLRFAGRLVSPA
jgi:hypothetical protein